jgi:hypothetical protein
LCLDIVPRTSHDGRMTPVLEETINDPWGSYIQRWMTTPPAVDQTYRVVEQTWARDHTLRVIHSWVPVGDP